MDTYFTKYSDSQVDVYTSDFQAVDLGSIPNYNFSSFS